MYLHSSILPYFLTWAFTYLCPYSKVEESFNMQALHDIAFLKTNISQYDHVKFPGVVPRTFVGAALLSFICAIPISMLMPFVQKFTLQLLVRFVLGTINVGCFLIFAQTARKRFGNTVYLRLMWISISQFHFFFYASRSLPNTFALPFVLLSLSSLLRTRDKQFVVLAGIATLIFRSELILFYGPCLLYGLVEGSVKLRPSLFLTVFVTGLGCIGMFMYFPIILRVSAEIAGLSLIVDSTFWQRLVWPEGEVFYYNTVLNKSGQWGIFPFHWYFTSALPRALLMTIVLLLLWAIFAVRVLLSGGLTYDRKFSLTSVGLISTALLFVVLYSWLPHKELRFIIYTVPVFNLAAAIVWAHLYNKTENIENNIALLEVASFTHIISEWPPDRMQSVSKAFEKLFTVHGFSGINIKPTWRLWESIEIQTPPRLFVYTRRENPR
ncbi:alpha-1,6-mannosyltransferase [Paragonimus westermani]|uniref:Mannosyltransferase n=1 Tax=Paragonimus westermani TaxID=34504 RepID=A0A5J4NE50_9TREM|nr:alpha-1,6-mannosyltransferase [Paragonimus westermani]